MSEFTSRPVSPAVEVWTIEGEPRMNTLRRAMVQELAQRVLAAGLDTNLRCVVLTGAGLRAFCAGADLKERTGWTEDDVKVWLQLLKHTFRELERSAKVFVAAINGAALGGGLELALACDLRVADPSALLGAPEVKLGIIPGAGGTQRLGRTIGVGRAKDLCLTGRRVGADEALSLGLVNRVTAAGKSVDEACALAAEMAENGPLALAEAKRAVVDGFGMEFDRALDLEIANYHRLLGSKDRLEGLAAFHEKRKPVFKGE